MSLKISFVREADGSEVTVDADPGETIVQAAYRAGVLITQTCGGTPSCTDCRVIVKKGIEDGFEPPEGPEKRLMGNVYFITHERLACQTLLKNDSCVIVPKARSIDSKKQRHSTGVERYGQKEEKQKSDKEAGEKESQQKGRKEIQARKKS
jgi:ferredoxin